MKDYIDYNIEHYVSRFSNNLLSKMKQKDITVSKLARVTKVDRSQIYKYINGETEPRLYFANKIAIALDCTIDDLVNGVGENK